MKEIAKAYDPKLVEPRWYQSWEDSGAFRGEPKEGCAAFSIVIPPPNVTGVLTMGHVLNNTIQDILARRARLKGKRVLWLPGTDHASIATHSVIERELRKEGVTRWDLGREQFIRRAWDWSDHHGGIILRQLRGLGCSCDWERTVFTMNEAYARAVSTAFVKLYERGYIYRGKYMVNWCPATLTALSNEEVIMKPQHSLLFKMRYEIVELPGQFMEISTTRPETLMGDTAVAVHPHDVRYRSVVGKHVWRPFPRAQIPIIADEAVDREFATGVLKITPAHDALDFEIGQRHGLPALDVINPDATMNELAGKDFVGLDRDEARKLATRKLDELGLLVEKEPYQNNVGYSERADVPIESRISEQWWMRYPKVEEAKRAVRDGLIRFWPQRWAKTYLHWLDNIQDWCVSRQLWWGHRIPIWYRKGCDRALPQNWHVSVDGPQDPENWEQDEDVLDTWASSWLWPFATMGWPSPNEKEAGDLAYFYPTTDLVTGPDIIFFWVARMIMAGLEFMGETKESLSDDELADRIPFRNVYFTGMIRDVQGRKMSKSLGNSPDPLDLIDRFGADGLRFGIMSIAPKGQDILFSEERIQGGRNICNKLWNACRFRQLSGALHDNTSLARMTARIQMSWFDEYDHWIIWRLVETVKQVESAFEKYEFNQLTQALYGFFWSDFCDWYLEVSKVKLEQPETSAHCLAIQDLVLRQVLLMLHPIAPYITEELFHRLGFVNEESLLQDCGVESPDELLDLLSGAGIEIDQPAAAQVECLKGFVSRARALKSQYNLSNRRDVTLFFTADEENTVFIESHTAIIKRLVGAGALEVRSDVSDAPGAVTALATVYLDLASTLDLEVERERLSKELVRIRRAVAAAKGRLGNEEFLKKAPAKIVAGARRQLLATEAKKDEIERLLAGLGG